MQGKMTLVARILFGLAFTVFGINGFLNFLPPPEPSAEGGAFLGALMATGYFFPFLKIVETVCGVLILIGRWVPLALT
ncbi:MAG: acyltransferase, partial [Thermoanaerobaculia bacterium]